MRFRNILLSAALIFSLSSCVISFEGDFGDSINAHSLDMYVGDSFRLEAFPDYGDWWSDYQFVSSVDSWGNVRANHVGYAEVWNGDQFCRVKVYPRYYTYAEPMDYSGLRWGATRNEIISYYGRPHTEYSDLLIYEVDDPAAPLLFLYLDGYDRLEEAVVGVSPAVHKEMLRFLDERYAYDGSDGRYDYYVHLDRSGRCDLSVAWCYMNDYRLYAVSYIPVYGRSAALSRSRSLPDGDDDIRFDRAKVNVPDRSDK